MPEGLVRLSQRQPGVRAGNLLGWTLVVLSSLALSGCAKLRKTPEGGGPLPPPPAGPLPLAGSAPAQPFDERLGENAFARDVFGAPGPARTEIAVRDLLLGPGARGQLAAPRGPAILDVQSGSGRATAGGKTTALAAGHPATLPAGSPVAIENTGETPLSARLYVIGGKQ